MNLPNYITIARIVLVPFFFSFLIYYNQNHPNFRILAIILFLVAMVTDALDGLIARKFKKQTKLGTFLDPFADKLLLLSGFLGIAFSQAFVFKPPLWIVVVIVFRDLFIICGLIIIYLTVNHIEIRPNLLGKITTFFQMVTILTVLTHCPYSEWIWFTTAGLTIASWMIYIHQGIRFLNSSNSKKA